MNMFVRIISLSLLASIFLSFAPFSALASEQGAPRVEIQNNQLFLDNRQLTKTPYLKSFPLLSPDSRKISFVCSSDGTSIFLGIADIQAGTEKYIKLHEQFTQVTRTEWLGNEKVGVQIHVNPDLDVYLIASLKQEKTVETYYGYSFIWDKSRSALLYIQAPPHSSTTMGDCKVMLNDSTLYQTGKNTAISSFLYPNASFGKVAFFTGNGKDDKGSSLMVLTLENNRVKAKNMVAWNRNTEELKWEGTNVLAIGTVGRFDLTTSRLIFNR